VNGRFYPSLWRRRDESFVRARGRSSFDKPGVDLASIDKILVDRAEFDAVLVDRDGARSLDDEGIVRRVK
jgi:hypothetical protein